MVLLYHGEPNFLSLKPLIALEEAGVEYESRLIGPEPLDWALPNYPPSIDQSINLEKEGPVLVDGEKVIVGSFFMLEYIGEGLGAKHLLPSGPLGRYEAQSIGQAVALTVSPSVAALGLSKNPLAAANYQGILPIERRDAWKATWTTLEKEQEAFLKMMLMQPLEKLEQRLADGRDWFVNNTFSIADIDVFASIRNLADLAPDALSKEAFPRLTTFIDKVAARPSVEVSLAKGHSARPENCFVPGPEVARWG